VFEQGIFEKIDIINLETYKYLLVISLKNGIVKTINLTLDRIIPRTKTEETARLLTNRLYGLKVSEIKNTIGKRVEGVSVADRKLLDVIIDKSVRIFSFFDERNLHISGIKKLLTKPDFSVPEYSMNLIDLFEHKHELAATLKNTMGETEDVKINIGCSDMFFSEPPLSIISATYHFGGIPGVIAVLGPTRIHYPKLFSIIKYMASETSKYLSS
jgi:heat-inducible transcriptional repressor